MENETNKPLSDFISCQIYLEIFSFCFAFHSYSYCCLKYFLTLFTCEIFLDEFSFEQFCFQNVCGKSYFQRDYDYELKQYRQISDYKFGVTILFLKCQKIRVYIP